MVRALEPLDNRLFDDRLAVADAEQRRIDRIPLHRERILSADPRFPRERLRAFKQLVKGLRGK